MVSTYYVVVLSGIFTGIGMLVLLFANIVRTVQSVRDMEIQKKRIEKENYDHLTGLPMRSHDSGSDNGTGWMSGFLRYG